MMIHIHKTSGFESLNFLGDRVKKFRMAVTQLSFSPPIFLTSSTNLINIPGTQINTLTALAATCRSNKYDPRFLIQPSWHFPKIVRDAPHAIDIIRETQARFGVESVIILANEPEDFEECAKLNIKCSNVHQNAFVSEKIFNNDEIAPKIRKAIYNAKLNSFKQHKLACEIDSLALIYAPTTGDESLVFDQLKKDLPHAEFVNGDPRTQDYRKLTTKEISQVLRQSKVGLCLSSIEGAMYASMEYLLCDLPVLSIPNKGGRDEFAQPGCWFSCQANPKDVADKLNEICQLDFDRGFVRHQTLTKIFEHRRRFEYLLREIAESLAIDQDWSFDWDFIHRYHGGLHHQSMEGLAERSDSISID